MCILSVAMVDREPKEHSKLSRFEQVNQEIVDYFAGEELGSGKLAALFDYSERLSLENIYERIIDELEGKTDLDPSDRLRKESHLRMIEIERALLNHKIHDNISRLQGYAETQNFIGWVGEDLYDACSDEVSPAHKELAQEQRKINIGEKYYMAWYDIRNTLLQRMFRNTDLQ